MKIEPLLYLQFLFFSVEILFVVWLANLAFNRIYGSVEPILRNNAAVAVQRLGFSFGCAMAMVSAVSGIRTDGFLTVAVHVFAYGAVSSLFVLIATVINDKIITADIDDNAEIRDRNNLSIAIVDASAAIATGFIAAASFSANGNAPAYAPLVFFVLGQAALVVTSKIFVRVAEIENEWLAKGNVAAGVSLGGMLIATGITLMNAISGPFDGWEKDLTAFGLSYFGGMLALLAIGAIVPRWFLGAPQHGQIKAGNTAMATYTAVFKVILALSIGTVVP